MKFIGIDPGMNGSIASLTKIGKGPKYNLHSTGKLGDYSEHDLIEYLTSLGSADQDVFAVVEKVGVMPHMGVRAAFTFGRMYGILIASITASGIPFIEVPGATWQKALGCLVRGRKGANDGYKDKKQANKRKVQQLYPKENITLINCDSILLATYCKQHYKELF